MRLQSIILVFLLLLSTIIYCQSDDTLDIGIDQTKHKFSWKVSLFNHSIALPFYKIIRTPIHPGIELGIERSYIKNKRSSLFQKVDVGIFRNKYNGSGIFIKTGLGYRYTTSFGLSIESNLGLGYLRIYHPADIYKISKVGTYEKIKDLGFSSPLVTFGFGLGYDVKTKAPIQITPFVDYAGLIQTRYSEALSVFPHSIFNLGIRLNKK